MVVLLVGRSRDQIADLNAGLSIPGPTRTPTEYTDRDLHATMYANTPFPFSGVFAMETKSHRLVRCAHRCWSGEWDLLTVDKLLAEPAR